MLFDLDRDGDLDIVYSPRQWLTWHENDGNGNFGAAKSQRLSGDPSTAMAIVDIDANGRFDILLPITVSYPTSVLAWFEFQDGQLLHQQNIAEGISPIESLMVVDVEIPSAR